jgi:multiple antibiotic resistance protein
MVVGMLLLASMAGAVYAQPAREPVTLAGQLQMQQFPVAQIFLFLFLMLGPVKIIAPFAAITRGANTALTWRIAARATLFASAALVVAALVGQSQLNSYGIPVPVLALAGGIILFLVALIPILQQFAPRDTHPAATGGVAAAPSLKVAMSPLAFPTIVTPYGIATLVVLLALAPDRHGQLMIGAIMAAIMALNFLAMIATRYILPLLGVVLPIVGAVLGVIQVALGLLVIQNSLKAMGIG